MIRSHECRYNRTGFGWFVLCLWTARRIILRETTICLQVSKCFHMSLNKTSFCLKINKSENQYDIYRTNGSIFRFFRHMRFCQFWRILLNWEIKLAFCAYRSKKIYVIGDYEICKYTLFNLFGVLKFEHKVLVKTIVITSAKFGRICQNITETVKFCAFFSICKHLFPIGNDYLGFMIYSSRMRSNFAG